MPTDRLSSLQSRIDSCLTADRHGFRQRLRRLRADRKRGRLRPEQVAELEARIDASAERLERRRAALPRPEFPEELPVSAMRGEIAAAIRDHQVVVVCGETGSGKTTQLPKICLELGRGAAGLIGHTQPRRIAARSVAARIAEELKTGLGQGVGFKVRFGDHTGPDTFIKLMTDGILLAEMQSDRYLGQYDTLIIDEAHERGLNIDFILGYLKRVLPKRPDLKVIITSATIDPERFSRHFDGAPIVEVSGRTYPVEVRYRPLLAADEDQRDRDQVTAILDAVDELSREGPGDILVFLAGEREIRETAEALRKHHPPHTEILPLYARLSAAEQNRVFKAHGGRRIVLATNVAETSLTVPGIRYVVDPGYARISRYSHRTKVQRLPVEKISQASANQRAGRCGRVAEGICIRLYSEEEFQARPEFTEPEILRTNLASVILQMQALGLGDVDAFEFVEAPDSRFIRDGYRLLEELGALDARGRLTETGRQLARLPIDPRLGRMLLAAWKEGSLAEVLVIVAALSIQDPRERPLDRQQAADQKQALFRHEQSDFLAFLKLWDWFHEQSRHLSQNKLRKLCREHFLSYVRMREWHDIHRQLANMVKDMGLRPNREEADYGAIHRALLTGLLGNVALKDGEKGEFLGARNLRLRVHPGSALHRKPPKWIMAAELVETTRLYARTVARIDPAWLEPLAGHLVRRSHSEPHWEKRPAQVAAYERVTLYGLPIVARRRVNYGPIDPVASREIFIREALVHGNWSSRAPFFRHNREQVAEIEALEAKARRQDILVDEEDIFAFYDERIPQGIYSGKSFERWRAKAERGQPRLLFLQRDRLLRRADGVAGDDFPDHLEVAGLSLKLEYHFDPSHAADGVTALVPVQALNLLTPERCDWLVPGLLREKVILLIKSLPKRLRRNFVPVPDFADACLNNLKADDGALLPALSHQLLRMTGVEIPADAWRPETLPPHLCMNFRVLGTDGRTLGQGRDLERLQAEYGEQARESFEALPKNSWHRDDIRDWDFGELPERVEFERDGLLLHGYPALIPQGEGAGLRLFDDAREAARQHRAGTRRLFALHARDAFRYLRRHLPVGNEQCLQLMSAGGVRPPAWVEPPAAARGGAAGNACEALKEDVYTAVIDQAFLADGEVRDEQDFRRRLESGRKALMGTAQDYAGLIRDIAAAYHAIARALSGPIPLHRVQAMAGVRAQLDSLVYRGFVSATPFAVLRHYPRYLKALQRRVEKAGDSRDSQLARQVAPLWERFERHAGQGVPEVMEFRWMIEELRVSLWAQELRTPYPVSVKRLEKWWKERIGSE